MLCVYCVKREATTEDHVIGRGFFDEPPAGGYIKVPACYPCNNKVYSRDEEYFLVALLAEATHKSPAADRVLSRLAKSHASGRRRLTGLARKLQANTRLLEVHSPAGLYLGRAAALALDTARANRVLEKIVRGLFFHEFDRPLPRTAQLLVEVKPSDEVLAEPRWRRLAAIRPRRCGDVFRYAYVASPKIQDQTDWLLGFYSSVLAVGITSPPSPLISGAS